MSTIDVIVNGKAESLAAGTDVADLVKVMAGHHSRVAVALNGEVVVRSAWAGTHLAPGDHVEILVAVAGG